MMHKNYIIRSKTRDDLYTRNLTVINITNFRFLLNNDICDVDNIVIVTTVFSGNRSDILNVQKSNVKIFQISAYRVSGLSCPEAGGCKSAILRGFPDVFSLFGPCKVGEISFRYSWTTGMKKKFKNIMLKKG